MIRMEGENEKKECVRVRKDEREGEKVSEKERKRERERILAIVERSLNCPRFTM